MHTRAYVKGEVEARDFPLDDVSEHLARPDTIVWVDLCRPTQAELDRLKDELGLHELAIEDALEPHQRPKLDHYATHLFLTCHLVHLEAAAELHAEEIDAFIGPRWFITVRKDDDMDIEPIVERWDRFRNLAQFGVPYLLYGLLDIVADSYFDVIDTFEDYYEAVSQQLFEEHPFEPSTVRERFEARQSLTKVHRLVTGMREAVSALLRRHDVVPRELDPYFQDVYDHLLRATEATDTLREMAGSIVETNLALRDFRQNQVMKKVTSWAAIIAVPTLITGYYGMNVQYPGIGTDWGFVVSIAVIVVCSFALYILFRKKGWL